MGISVFLSYPKPCFGRQQAFVDAVVEHLKIASSVRGRSA
jgi:hypothetical protein